jgi:hypothetical protein
MSRGPSVRGSPARDEKPASFRTIDDRPRSPIGDRPFFQRYPAGAARKSSRAAKILIFTNTLSATCAFPPWGRSSFFVACQAARQPARTANRTTSSHPPGGKPLNETSPLSGGLARADTPQTSAHEKPANRFMLMSREHYTSSHLQSMLLNVMMARLWNCRGEAGYWVP